ncbi:hypothetical protein SSX86_016238 [Deinandra increscens subsp. villosa]|uniref:Uncharacterized protein n=1 Tax=Deinandra increscens subsp. villosa TaxID=3103831 RepID=A0AAP0CXK3_9ASTR
MDSFGGVYFTDEKAAKVENFFLEFLKRRSPLWYRLQLDGWMEQIYTYFRWTLKLWPSNGTVRASWLSYWRHVGITNTIGPAMGVEALKYINYHAQYLQEIETIVGCLSARCEGNDQFKKSRKKVLSKEFDNFQLYENENITALVSILSHLISEIKIVGIGKTDEELKEKIMEALPEKWENYVLFLTHDKEYSTLTFHDLTGKLHACEMEIMNSNKSKANLQNPELYHDNNSSRGCSFTIQESSHQNCVSAETTDDCAKMIAALISSSFGLVIKNVTDAKITRDDLDELDDDQLNEWIYLGNMLCLVKDQRVKEEVKMLEEKNATLLEEKDELVKEVKKWKDEAEDAANDFQNLFDKSKIKLDLLIKASEE